LSSPFLFLSIGAGALKLLLVVLGMCPDPLHVYHSVLILDLNNKTMLVPFDIKYDSIIGQEVCAAQHDLAWYAVALLAVELRRRGL